MNETEIGTWAPIEFVQPRVFKWADTPGRVSTVVLNARHIWHRVTVKSPSQEQWREFHDFLYENFGEAWSSFVLSSAVPAVRAQLPVQWSWKLAAVASIHTEFNADGSVSQAYIDAVLNETAQIKTSEYHLHINLGAQSMAAFKMRFL